MPRENVVAGRVSASSLPYQYLVLLVLDSKPTVISLNQNYFELFHLEESFEVDLTAIKERYRDLQNQTHPDRFSAAPEADKMRAIQSNSFVNEAYNTLKSPLSRADYLLQLHGIDTGQASQNDLEMDLLMEQMQLREKLAELPPDESALTELNSMKQDVKKRIQDSQLNFNEKLNTKDLQSAKQIFFEMQFLQKLFAEIEQGEEKRLGY